jgi:hypothetical protein
MVRQAAAATDKQKAVPLDYSTAGGDAHPPTKEIILDIRRRLQAPKKVGDDGISEGGLTRHRSLSVERQFNMATMVKSSQETCGWS